jgi:hypothetical protein
MPSGQASMSPDASRLINWCAKQASYHGFVVERVNVIREQPWATAIRLDVSRDGVRDVLWAKSIEDRNRFETDVIRILESFDAPSLVRSIASDRAHGYLLLEDGGPVLSTLVDNVGFSALSHDVAAQSLASWRHMLELYGQTQRSSASSVESFLAAGCLDLRPAGALAYFDWLVDDDNTILRFARDGVTSGELVSLRASRSKIHAAVQQLATSTIAPTIQHDDIGPSNVCLDGRLIDWGDACVAHPFASLLTALRSNPDNRPGSAADRVALESQYLRGWLASGTDNDVNSDEDDNESIEQLRQEAQLACLIAPLGRISSWLRAPEVALDLYPGALATWVRYLIDSEL